MVKARLWVLIAVLFLPSVGVLRAEEPGGQWFGVLWTKGTVAVGNTRVSSGTTVVPRDVITTADGSSAWVRFRSPASAVLMADTEVALLATDSMPGFLLHRGTLVLDERMAEPIQVAVPGGYVLIQGDTQNGAQCQVATTGSGATVSVTRGLAEVHGEGAPVILRAGQSARVEAGPRQASQPVAGRISREIPQGEIHRGEGQAQVLPLKLQEVVLCNDLVRTLQSGRAQITLVDGSTLSVGARSQIRVVSHAADKQQTVIDVTEGAVRANVQKITAPNGKFELVTKSAVIGTIDTSFVAASDDKGTHVCGVDGTTSVKSLDPKITKQVKLHKKECTYVPFGGAPTDPIYSPSEMSSLLSQTAVSAPGVAITPSTAIGVAVAGGVGAAIAGIVLAPATTTSPTAP